MTSRALLTASEFEFAKKRVRSAFLDFAQSRRVFVTISRQCGTSGSEFAHALAERLNQLSGHGAMAWTAWDHELIQRVASAEGISQEIVARIEDRPHTWIEELGDTFATGDYAEHTGEFHVYKRIVATMRALASAGHCILVGQGGRWATAKMPGGFHLRLVAPIEHRVLCTARVSDLTQHEAVDRVHETDRNRTRFFGRYWPGKTLDAERFAMTLNTAELSVEDMVECAAPVVVARQSGALSGARRMTTAV